MAAAGVAFAVVESPLLAMSAAFSGLLLLIGDYTGYEKGEQSALPGLWRRLDEVSGKMKGEWAGSIGNFQKNVHALSQDFQNLADNAKAFEDHIKDIIGTVKGDWDKIRNFFNDAYGSLAPVIPLPPARQNLGQSPVQSPAAALMSGYHRAAALIGGYSLPIGGGSVTNTSHVTHQTMSPVINATYNISGTGDPKAVATAIERTNVGLLIRSMQGVIV